MLIFLVGYMGAGKSSQGSSLAKALNYQFVDTDVWIESRCCKTIPAIFEEFGESFFREKEKDCIEFLVDKDNYVIATGGGLPCHNDLMDLMNELGTTIFLEASVSSLSSRLVNEIENRPLLKETKSLTELNLQIKEHLQFRSFFYSQSEQKVLVDLKSSIQLESEIINILKLYLY